LGRNKAPRGSAPDDEDEDEDWGPWKDVAADKAAGIRGVEAAPAADEAAEIGGGEADMIVFGPEIGEGDADMMVPGEEIGEAEGAAAEAPAASDPGTVLLHRTIADKGRTPSNTVFLVVESDEDSNLAAESLTPRRRCRTKRRVERVDSPRRVQRRGERHEQKKRLHRSAREARRADQLLDGIPRAEEAAQAVVGAVAIAAGAIDTAQNTLQRLADERRLRQQSGLGHGLQYPLLEVTVQRFADAVSAAHADVEYTLKKLDHLRVRGIAGLPCHGLLPDVAAAEVGPALDAAAAEGDPVPAAAAAQQPQPRQPRPQNPRRCKGWARMLWWAEHQRRQQAAWADTGGGGYYFGWYD
jgi:hypothetical protein